MRRMMQFAAAFLLGGVTLALALDLQSAKSNPKDPTVLAPGMYRVVLENEHLRVIDYRLKPGEKEPMHSHPKGVFVYYFTDAATRGNIENGEPSGRHNKEGDVVWRDPVTHIAENIGHAEIHQLLVGTQGFL